MDIFNPVHADFSFLVLDFNISLSSSSDIMNEKLFCRLPKLALSKILRKHHLTLLHGKITPNIPKGLEIQGWKFNILDNL